MSVNQDDIEIIVGTYEDYVVGYRVETSARKQNGSDNPAPMYLEQSFAVRGHSGSVRCVTSSPDGSLVCSTGYDEMINVFSLKRRKLLQTTENSVNCAIYVGNSHLLCGSENSDIHIYECKTSEMKLVKTLRGHKSAIKCIDAHPSGKILLSIAKDQSMRTWNLIKGRCAYVTNIRTDAHMVKWSKTGNEFMIAAHNEIYLYSNLGNLKRAIKMDKRVTSIEFVTDQVFIVATDSGNIEFLHLDVCGFSMRFDTHEARIKSVCCLICPNSVESENDEGAPLPGDCDNFESVFATASSDGSVRVWSMTMKKDLIIKGPREVAKVDVGARLTCMIVSKRKID